MALMHGDIKTALPRAAWGINDQKAVIICRKERKHLLHKCASEGDGCFSRKAAGNQQLVDVLNRPEDMHPHFVNLVDTVTSYNRRP